MAQALTIGQLAQATGVSPRTIRYYEEVGVLPRPGRTPAGYRQYAEQGVHRLRFIRRARALGLPLQHLKALAAVLDGGPRTTVRPRLLVLVRAQLSAVHEQISELQFLQGQLEQVLHQMLTRRAPNHAEGCRCLETDVVPVGTGKPSRLRQGNAG